MTTIISAKLKKIGQREYNNIRIEVPEKLSEKLENYNIEILDLNKKRFSEAFIFIVNENKEDVLTVRLNPHLKDSFKESFEKIFEFLTIEELMNYQFNLQENKGAIHDNNKTIL